MSLNRWPFLAALLIAAAFPAASMAVTADHTGAVDSVKNKFEWDSKLGTGFSTVNTNHDGQIGCGTAVIHDCDETLLHVTGCGTLAVTNTGTTPNAVDTDLYGYYSNAKGDKVETGPSSAQSTPTPNEAISMDMEQPDSYILIEIDYTDNVAGTVHGVATFTPADPTQVDPTTCIPIDTGDDE